MRKFFKIIAGLAVFSASLFSVLQAGGDKNWYFSAYYFKQERFVTIGPYSSWEECDDHRQGYLRNDNYRNVSGCGY